MHLLKVTRRFLVSMRTGETPVPIPNTTVKTCAADGTMLETAWESRWMPGLLQKLTRESVLYRTDISEWAELITKPVRPNGEKDVLT